jgi:predicted nucleotidyltransferase component of viral defense system
MGSKVLTAKFDADCPGDWRSLFVHGLALMREMRLRTRPDALWTFGGGTVLMLRHAHRLSKDIDLFVPDPQYLGFVNPRLSDVAAGVSDNYVEAMEYIKLMRPEGEIDIVASHNLTAQPWTLETIMGESVCVETDVEIVAKKMWHRGGQATARDLFDLALVLQTDRAGLEREAQWMVRHTEAFLQQIEGRRVALKVTFDAITRLPNARVVVPDYDACVAMASEFLLSI